MSVLGGIQHIRFIEWKNRTDVEPVIDRRERILRPVVNSSYSNMEFTNFQLLQSDFYLDPLEFWKIYENQFPSLAALAKKLFVIANSQAAIERIFSIAGILLTMKRCSMSPKNLSRMVKLKKNFLAIKEFLQRNKNQ